MCNKMISWLYHEQEVASVISKHLLYYIYREESSNFPVCLTHYKKKVL